MIEKLLRDAAMLWATIDPIGTLALFAGLTARLSTSERRNVALRATLYAAVILVGSIVVGQIILDDMGIRLISLQVAGGIILFVFALQMIFGSGTESPTSQPESGHDLAVFPLAVPSIASPGAIMAAILLTDNDLYTITQQATTTAVLLGVLAITCLLMLLSGPILRVIGRNGAAILIRVMGMVLAALSVELVMQALGIEKWVHTKL
jgi:multiple antibiotic resistance protein